jgi:hypothetical protein
MNRFHFEPAGVERGGGNGQVKVSPRRPADLQLAFDLAEEVGNWFVHGQEHQTIFKEILILTPQAIRFPSGKTISRLRLAYTRDRKR